MRDGVISSSIIIGIDIAKDTFEVAFMSASDGRVLKRSSYANNWTGHRAFIGAARFESEAHRGDVQVVMEATGNYHSRVITT